ncbi:NosD domain-containing protein [Methanosarcina sp. 1.H.A.2.2]|uniref:NosD domain-containing protein n=1 Tax=Methanosarcina sp. 1.H.A.2.2 TaxID=1483601 RepID=UPI00062296CB|nr:NosD domain-containing protein [Methanosarcina sp. 1.H.A.2.2]KKH48740.1 cell surface protein [Methanosarcina sp. 1.H.A.2.2]
MWVNKLTILLVVAIFLAVAICSSASAREITVDNSGSGADFKSIQEAVNSSSSGDIILVYPGLYNESVDVGVQNISIISESENPEDTTVRAFKISENNITVSGFSIQEVLKYDGHYSYPVENCTIKNNVLKLGTYANECYNFIIEKNIIVNGGIGVSSFDYHPGSNFTISDNLIVEGSIDIYLGPYVSVINNTLLNGSIGLVESGGHRILGNHISNSPHSGINLWESYSNEIEDNTVVNCSNGISMEFLSSQNTINNNTLICNDKGIWIKGSGGSNSLLNNTISKNNIGILVEADSSSNLVANNKVELNKKYGVYLNGIAYTKPFNRTNRFYNNIFNNTVNVFNDTSSHYTTDVSNRARVFPVAWNTTKTSGTNIVGGSFLGGNYWAKPDGTGFSQTCNDWNRDGIGDSIYTVSAYDIDYLPLVSISKQDQTVFPVADFSANVTGGYVPLSVMFTDFSQNATSRVWDFDNDGVADSTDKTPVHVYPVSGTYIVNLTVNNANGTFSRLYPIIASNRPQYTLREVQITTNISNQMMPAIYGDKIVFLDDRNEWRYYNIYVYDLSTSRETQITFNNSYYNTGPAIYEDRIVWQEYRNDNNPNVWDKFDIHMYNLSTSKETQITNSGRASNPAIYGNRIVYIDKRNGNSDVYLYDLSTSNEIQITKNGSASSPDIYGNRIVWQDNRDNKGYSNSDIYLYDLSNSTKTQITTNESDQKYPAIYGDKIVWEDWRNRNADIYMYDLSLSEETRITIKGSSYIPAIYEDRIVWQDNRRGYPNNDIYMYNLSTHTETQITSNKSWKGNFAIYGYRIVWDDLRNGHSMHDDPYANADIYMCTVSEVEPSLKAPVADFFANITSGSAPLKVLFTDNSTGAPIYWFWDFGDGIHSKHALNATHTFNEPGKYDVSLTVTNENGSNTRIIPEYIVVSEDERQVN